MHILMIVLLIMFCSGCARLSSDIPTAPVNNAKAVVFDVDGTLTPTVLKYWQARSDAAKAVQFFAARGYKIIYLSSRISILQSNIPDWLKDNGFPDGNVHVTETVEDKFDSKHFKTRILRDYLARGWKIAFAFGDSSTDFDAYAAVGIPRERIFALRREGEHSCQPGVWKVCLNGWAEHLDAMARQI